MTRAPWEPRRTRVRRKARGRGATGRAPTETEGEETVAEGSQGTPRRRRGAAAALGTRLLCGRRVDSPADPSRSAARRKRPGWGSMPPAKKAWFGLDAAPGRYLNDPFIPPPPPRPKPVCGDCREACSVM